MKKFIKCLVLLICLSLTLTLVSCGKKDKNKESNEKNNSNISENQPVAYTVEYVGTSMATTTVNEGTSISQPTEPTKTGYIFGGWYADSSYKDEVKFPLVINSNTKIYAKFYDLKEAFIEARQKTIGDDVEGYEYDYTTTATAAYGEISLNGTTTGNAKYAKGADVSFYDAHQNSGILFYDGSKYQIRRGNQLQKISLDEDDLMRKYSIEEVDDSYKFDSSSFAKALFSFTDDKLKSVEATSTKNKYKLNTSMTVSDGIALVGNYINSPIVEKLIGALPETSINTIMYVTFSDGKINSYQYEMHVDVSSIKFDLVYNLAFKNVGVKQNISPRVFANLSLSSSEIASSKGEINTYLSNYKNSAASSYDFLLKTGVDFEGKNEINSTFNGSATRAIVSNKVYFFNKIEIDSDFKNADLYKSQDIDDYVAYKTKLSNGEVYNIQHRTLLKDLSTLVDPYTEDQNDNYYLFGVIDQITNVTFIQKIVNDKKGTITYCIGFDSQDVAKILSFFNNNADLDPLNKATADVNIYGEFNSNSIVVDESEFTIVIENGKLASIKLTADGEYITKFADSRDFTNLASATFDLKFTIDTTTDGDSFVPFEDVSDAK